MAAVFITHKRTGVAAGIEGRMHAAKPRPESKEQAGELDKDDSIKTVGGRIRYAERIPLPTR
jgi:hypothetical protein